MLVIAHILSKISYFSVGFCSVQLAEYIIFCPYICVGLCSATKKLVQKKYIISSS
jgi:hypothetical protein